MARQAKGGEGKSCLYLRVCLNWGSKSWVAVRVFVRDFPMLVLKDEDTVV